ncbi:hypothetical protein BFP76_10625 [Amylibacter kogurei]|uniref:Polysaccharide biosynthesis protein CapD-like domain-containing protein n=1 Tax=Paramylibacter kogurei TaxID=1889778 RepID=A0A2G5KBE1_9RHOB|nr:nucleoside-diphosphate sugar epimerase/dehydratase [Amylibacter kogurei]PIB26841.1 hypothetical protein BFP76_10625 [Amylibacter kogurei]
MYKTLTSLPRFQKTLILLLVDTAIVPIALYMAYALRLSDFTPFEKLMEAGPTLLAFICVAPMVIIANRLHRFKLGTFESSAIIRTAKCTLYLAAVCTALNMMTDYTMPRTIPILFGILFFVGSIGTRIFAQNYLSFANDRDSDTKRVLIYGAGSAGTQLAFAMRQQNKHRIVGFADDNVAIHGIIIAGQYVYPANDMPGLIKKMSVDRIVVALPSVQGKPRSELLKSLNTLDCEVRVLPSFDEMIDGDGLLEKLRPVSPNDLLGREKVDLNLPVVADTYAGKNVLITGAGGSIGSELCRQLIACDIKSLILMDHAEFNLYAIEAELHAIAHEKGIPLIPVLGSVLDENQAISTLQKHNVDIVMHAAAYKHVPMVEANEISGLMNNVMGTRVMATAALRAKIDRFVLISTDKAVRPTNIMGASKRMAELVVQDIAERSKTTLFSMVRFGNVLGSSGSVIPLFRKQIEAGGPVTVTHSDVTRFFMTISEAARLVLLCGCFARGGDVFVLDMGKPMKIIDMARMMIELSGRSVRDEDTPNGDIEIAVVGLRPGEKLYEELLIGNDMLTTPHPKILRAQEGQLSEIEVANMIKDLNSAFETEDSIAARELVTRWVDGYQAPIASNN